MKSINGLEVSRARMRVLATFILNIIIVGILDPYSNWYIWTIQEQMLMIILPIGFLIIYALIFIKPDEFGLVNKGSK